MLIPSGQKFKFPGFVHCATVFPLAVYYAEIEGQWRLPRIVALRRYYANHLRPSKLSKVNSTPGPKINHVREWQHGLAF